MSPPSWQYWPAAGLSTPGTKIVSNAYVDANVTSVEQSIKSDGSTSMVNGASGLTFEYWQFRDATKDGSWTDDGFGLLFTTSSPADETNHSGWVSLLPTASGSFYVYETGTATEIFRLNWVGSSSFATNSIQRYGSSSVDFEGSIAAHNTRVDIYYS